MATIIRTDSPLTRNRAKMNQVVASFWNKTSEAWYQIWGPHIHHGYYEDIQNPIPPLQAQELLIKKLVHELEFNRSSKILDVGCGMGGSSFYLAQNYDATVNGISLSHKQIEIAKKIAIEKKLKNVSFSLEDALSLTSFMDNSFDIVWSLESCEQFTNKDLFLEKAFNKLLPGGKLLLATWCSSEEEYHGAHAKQYIKLCRAFDLPYMPTMDHYQQLLSQQGYIIQKRLDWTDKVKVSWNLGVSLVNAYSFLRILKLAGWRGFRFTKQLKLMQDAFNNNQIVYGVFVATKP